MSDFIDYCIVPNGISAVTSRKQCDTSLLIEGLTQDYYLDLPLILSPMSFFEEPAIKIINNRFIYLIPRIQRSAEFPSYVQGENWNDINVRLQYAKKYAEEGRYFGVSVGLNDSTEDVLKFLQYTSIICVDTANGYTSTVLKYVAKLSAEIWAYVGEENYDRVHIISGNVVDSVGFANLVNNGVKLVRVGIGASNVCLTNVSTGVGRNQMNALRDISSYTSTGIVCDGGIRTSRDFCLAMLYSDMCMVNTLFKFTEINSHDVDDVCHAYGMASQYAKNHNNFVEGKLTTGATQSFEEVYKGVKESLQSAMSYIGAFNLSEYTYKNTIVEKV